MNGTNLTITSASGLTLDVEPEIRSGGNLLFFSSGEVVDPESMIRVGTFPGLSVPPYLPQPANHICPDMTSGRVYYLTPDGSIVAYSLNTYQPVATLRVSGISGMPEQLVRWGANGLAFATTGGQLFSIRTLVVPVAQYADLSVTQMTPPSASLLSNYTMTITVSNQGPGLATGIVVNDILPTGMRFLSAATSQGTLSSSNGTLTAVLGTLSPGFSAQLSIVLRPDAIGSPFNYVRVAANEPDPVMTNNSSSQTIAAATYFSQNLPFYVGDLVYDPSRGKVFATVQSTGPYSNSIIQIDPLTANVEQTLPTSFTPGKIAISTDSQFLYVGTASQDIVARVNIQAWTNDLSFNLGYDLNGLAYIVGDFAPLAGQPHSIVVSMHTWYGYYNPRVAIFDDGVVRPDRLSEGGGGTYFIQASQDGSRLYVVNGDQDLFDAPDGLTFSAHPITASGIGPAITNISGYASDFKMEDNLLITQSGQALNVESNAALGTFPATGLVAPDLESGIVYFLVEGWGVWPTCTLTACSTNMSNIVWQITVPSAVGTAYSLIPCGPGTFAFATQPYYAVSYATWLNQLFFVHTSAVPPAGDLVLNVNTNVAFAGGFLTNTFSISNDGPYNATGVTFSNDLASGSTFIAASSTQGRCVETNGVVTCGVGSMTAGASVMITVVSLVTNAGSNPLVASASQNEPDIDPSNNQIALSQFVYPAPAISVADVSVHRENGLTATFNITLASSNSQPMQLYCSTRNGSAVAPGDYVATSRNVTVPPGVTNFTFPVAISNNGQVESNVVFYLNVKLAPIGASLATASCILLNDNFYSFLISNTFVRTSITGATNALFSVTLSGANTSLARVDYFTRDGSAIAGRDYMAKSGTLVFPPGITNAPLSIPVFATSDFASLKTFYLVLANPVNALIGVPQALASIVNGNVVIGSGELLADGRFQITVSGGTPGQRYVLLASTNLSDWTPIGGFVDTNPPVRIFDPDATQYPHRFYRIGPMSLAPPMTLDVSPGQPLNDYGFRASLYALPGLTYEIDASTNLISWQPITNFLGTNFPFVFQDLTATNYNRRFYRAVLH
jgi:uncharacterized repeat protein (TIGR01451 family)